LVIEDHPRERKREEKGKRRLVYGDERSKRRGGASEKLRQRYRSRRGSGKNMNRNVSVS